MSFVSPARFTVEINSYLIKVGASPLENTLRPPFFQLRTNVEIVIPPPWKNPLPDREAEVV